MTEAATRLRVVAPPELASGFQLGGATVHAVADGLLADFACHLGERPEDEVLTVAFDILQCIHVGGGWRIL